MLQIIDETCVDQSLAALAKKVDLIFTATPQGFCGMHLTEKILSQYKVIDLSADFRLKSSASYTNWYKLSAAPKTLLQKAIYDLPELYREQIAQASLVANPGCYPTCSILTIYPLLKEGYIASHGIIINAKSGISGAGRSNETDRLFCEVNENIKAYGLTGHRHILEIEEQLAFAAGEKITLNFIPHLIPMNRGIFITAYTDLKKPADYDTIKAVYDSYYGNESFIRILGKNMLPQSKWVENSNFVDIQFQIDPRTNKLLLSGTLDNLIKGAAGQAIQNMNLLFQLPEYCGLTDAPIFP